MTGRGIDQILARPSAPELHEPYVTDAPAKAVVHELPGGQHLIVGACAHESSGVPDHWAALTEEPGVNLLPDLSNETAADVVPRVGRHKLPGDVAVLSIHWGSNWEATCHGSTPTSHTAWWRAVMFFPSFNLQTGQLLALEMTPLQIQHMRLNRASLADARWICDTVNKISLAFGTEVTLTEHAALRWSQNHAAA